MNPTVITEWLEGARALAARDRDLRRARRNAPARWLRRASDSLARTSPYGRLSVVAVYVAALVMAIFDPAGLLPNAESATASSLITPVAILALLLTNYVPHVSRFHDFNELELLRAPSLPSLVIFRWLRTQPDRIAYGALWAGTVVALQRATGTSASGAQWIFAVSMLFAPGFFAAQWLYREALYERLGAWSCVAVCAASHAAAVGLALSTPLGGTADPGLALALLWLAGLALATPLLLVAALRSTSAHRTTSTEIHALSTEGPDFLTPRESDVTLPTQHAGRRSLLASQWLLFACKLRVIARAAKRRPLVSLLLVLVLLLMSTPLLLAIAGVWLTAGAQVSFLWLVFAAWTSRTVLNIREERHLHLIGVDLREQVRHNVTWGLVLGAFPTLLAGAVAAWCFGASTERLAALALLAGLLVLRAGWHGLWHRTIFDSHATLSVLLPPVIAALVLFGGGLPVPVAWASASAAVVLGLVGIARRLVRTETDLRAELRAGHAAELAAGL